MYCQGLWVWDQMGGLEVYMHLLRLGLRAFWEVPGGCLFFFMIGIDREA